MAVLPGSAVDFEPGKTLFATEGVSRVIDVMARLIAALIRGIGFFWWHLGRRRTYAGRNGG